MHTLNGSRRLWETIADSVQSHLNKTIYNNQFCKTPLQMQYLHWSFMTFTVTIGNWFIVLQFDALRDIEIDVYIYYGKQYIEH